MQTLLHTMILDVLAFVVSLVIPLSSLEPKAKFITSEALLLQSGAELLVRGSVCS
jgi:hypothetical protein